MTWAEVDSLRAQYPPRPRRIAHHGRVVFATIFEVRFVSWPTGDEVLALRPCHHVKGKWRALDRRTVASLRSDVEIGDARWWGADVREVLVALDAWLEAGCPARKWHHLEAKP